MRVAATDTQEISPSEYFRISEHEIPLLADQENIAFWDKEWIVPELKELLFGQPSTGPHMRTYFIVDATLRKNVTGVFDIESSTLDVPVECLYKGKSAEDLQEAAPYLIDMTLPDNAWGDKDLVPKFHKNFFAQHWGENTGSFIRSPAVMADVCAHFRKFTRIQTEESKQWVYFAFWDCRVAFTYFKSIRHMPEKVLQWVDRRGAPLVHAFLGEVEHSNSIWRVMPERRKLEGFSSAGTPMLSNTELDSFRLHRVERFANRLVQQFKQKDPLHAQAVGDKPLKHIIMTGVSRAKTYGLTREDPVRLYIQLMLGLGVAFDEDPMLPWAAEVLKEDSHPDGQAGKANVLRNNLLAYLKDVNGAKGDHLVSFSQSMQRKLPKLQEHENAKTTYDFLTKAHPQKARYIGAEMLQRLIEHTAQMCSENGFEQGRSVFILTCMRFAYGAGVVDDPQYLWLGEIVYKDPKDGPKDELLHKVFLKFMAKVNDYVKEAV